MINSGNEPVILNPKQTLEQTLRALNRLQVKELVAGPAMLEDVVIQAVCLGIVLRAHALHAEGLGMQDFEGVPWIFNRVGVGRMHYNYATVYDLIFQVNEKYKCWINDRQTRRDRYAHVYQVVQDKLQEAV